MAAISETDLYGPVKAFLEGQGYSVKGEIGRCDVVAVQENADPVIVELKTAFSLPLVFQALQRQSVSDLVYLAVPAAGGGLWKRQRRDIVKLCRMLGLGLLAVDTVIGHVEVHLDPAPYQPRKSPRARQRLLGEFQRRVGDPTMGGGRGRPVMTAYRQDALRCARHLAAAGPMGPAALRDSTGIARAGTILRDDVYGWFERVERGIYRITPVGLAALETFADAVAALDADGMGTRAPKKQAVARKTGTRT